MNNPLSALPATRREFLRWSSRGIGLLAFSRFAPAFLTHTTLAGAPPPERDRTVLVLIQLAGGNDGLNTVVPCADDAYYRLRPALGLPRRELLPLDDHHGLHPSLAAFQRLLDDGQLAIVQNVGYPNPNRSHFRSSEIWETASDSDDYASTGWIGRYFDNNCCGEPAERDTPLGVHLTSEVPQSFLSAQPHNIFGVTPAVLRRENPAALRAMENLLSRQTAPAGSNLAFLQHTMLDALATEKRIQGILGAVGRAGDYPAGQLGRSLRSIAALIGANLPTRVYFASLGGFDTHGNQLQTHAQLLRQLADAMAAFQGDLKERGLADQVLTMTFSEFGRRPSENRSRGTDHGTAAPLFVMGSRIRAGLHGTPPSLAVGPNEDLAFSTDFRSIYATVLDRWLGCSSREVLGGTFPPLELI